MHLHTRYWCMAVTRINDYHKILFSAMNQRCVSLYRVLFGAPKTKNNGTKININKWNKFICRARKLLKIVLYFDLREERARPMDIRKTTWLCANYSGCNKFLNCQNELKMYIIKNRVWRKLKFIMKLNLNDDCIERKKLVDNFNKIYNQQNKIYKYIIMIYRRKFT